MDLTTETGIQAYLQSTVYPSCSSVERLPEGVGGFVYRVAPNDSPNHPATVIVKHVESYAARATQWKMDQGRLEYEYKALQLLSTLNPQIEGIRAPKVLHFDREAWVIVIEDAGKAPSLKGWLQPNANLENTVSMGAAMGTFLATVHNMNAGNNTMLQEFNGNVTAKYISGTVYFGNLPQAAERFGDTSEYIRQAAQQGESDVQNANEVLTLGDFWTGNVLVGEDCQLFVVDLELSKPGTAEFDIGQMAAELHCVAAFRSRQVGTSILNAFLTAYRQARKGNVDAAKVAIRIAAHLFVIMPSAWANEASKEQIEEEIKLAGELAKLGVERDVEGLRTTLVSPLIS